MQNNSKWIIDMKCEFHKGEKQNNKLQKVTEGNIFLPQESNIGTQKALTIRKDQ